MNVRLHASASTFGNAAEITRWHLEKGWRTIGYHLVVLNGWLSKDRYNEIYDGHIETGRAFDDDSVISPDEVGAHTYGYNKDCIAICIIKDKGQELTEKQFLGIQDALFQLQEIFGSLTIDQHSDYDPKKPDCAGVSQEYIDYFNSLFN